MKRLTQWAALFVLATLTACSMFDGTRQLYRQAETLPDHARAVLIHHNAIGAQVATLIESGVSDDTEEALTALYRGTVCSEAEEDGGVSTANCTEGPAWRLERAAMAYEALTSAETEQELEAALAVVVGEIAKLAQTIEGAGS